MRRLKSYQASFQWYETRNQLQEESWKNHKYVENEQHATKQLLGQQKIEIKIYLKMNGKENRTNQNLLEAAKAVLREKFIDIQAYLKKQEKSQLNNLTLHLKELEKKNR